MIADGALAKLIVACAVLLLYLVGVFFVFFALFIVNKIEHKSLLGSPISHYIQILVVNSTGVYNFMGMILVAQDRCLIFSLAFMHSFQKLVSGFCHFQTLL